MLEEELGHDCPRVCITQCWCWADQCWRADWSKQGQWWVASDCITTAPVLCSPKKTPNPDIYLLEYCRYRYSKTPPVAMSEARFWTTSTVRIHVSYVFPSVLVKVEDRLFFRPVEGGDERWWGWKIQYRKRDQCQHSPPPDCAARYLLACCHHHNMDRVLGPYVTQLMQVHLKHKNKKVKI